MKDPGITNFYAEAGIGINGDKVYSGLYSDAVESNRSVRMIAKLDAGAEVTCIAFHVSNVTVRSSAEPDTKFEAIRL